MNSIKSLIDFFDNNNLVNKMTNIPPKLKQKQNYSFYDDLIYQLDILIKKQEVLIKNY